MNPFAKHVSTSQPLVRNGYAFRPIQDGVPGGWISKSRLNGIAISSGQKGTASGGIIVLPTDASVAAAFWDHLEEWSNQGIGSQHRRVTVGRFFMGSFETEREQFNQVSVCLEIDEVDEEELVEVATLTEGGTSKEGWTLAMTHRFLDAYRWRLGLRWDPSPEASVSKDLTRVPRIARFLRYQNVSIPGKQIAPPCPITSLFTNRINLCNCRM
jgi:hypothetical protein